MKLFFIIVCLLHSHGSSYATVDAKRYEYQSMVDPLTRRSPLDKNFMRFGRSSTPPNDEDKEDLHRLSRAKDNFIRFGRSEKELDNFLRTERARQDNFIRFGRGRDVQNFIRFGRGRDNFMRFGRGRNENFMRFGRGKQENQEDETEQDFGQKTIRSGGPKSTSNFMRFGRDDLDDTTPVDRASRGKSNFLRFGRSKDSGFIRFGRPFQDRHTDGFIRFGRKDQRNKRSLVAEDDLSLYQMFKDYCNEIDDPESSPHGVPYDADEDDEGASRVKRSVEEEVIETELPGDVDSDVTLTHLKPLTYPYPLSAGLPNFIVGPEFSLLPPLDTSSTKLKRGRPGDRNFIRLG